jgi:RES domain-containing protein
LTLKHSEVVAIATWATSAVPLAGLYFRSVEYRHMDPKDVVSGAGTQTYGGRFASVGTKAVYLSVTDSGASKEVTARKARLGGSSQITLSKYPRVVYAVSVKLKRVLDLTVVPASPVLKALRKKCLSANDLAASMELAEHLQKAGVQGLVFPSVVAGGDDNLVVYLANCKPGSLKLENEAELIAQAKLISSRTR